MSKKLKSVLLVSIIVLISLLAGICIYAKRINENAEMTNSKKSTWKITGDLSRFPNNLFELAIINGDEMYYISTGEHQYLHMRTIDGKSDKNFNVEAYNLMGVENNWLYYTKNEQYFGIHRIKLDGTQDQVVIGKGKNQHDEVIGYYIQDNWIYYIKEFGDKTQDCNLYRAKADGSSTEKLSDKYISYFNITKDGFIYYLAMDNTGSEKLFKMHVDGSDNVLLINAPDLCIHAFQIVNDNIYYSCGSINKSCIYRIKDDGTCNTKIIDNIDTFSFAVQNDSIYINDGDCIIYKINLNGENMTKLYILNDAKAYEYMLISGDWIYLTEGLYATNMDNYNKPISRLKIDGSSKALEKVN